MVEWVTAVCLLEGREREEKEGQALYTVVDDVLDFGSDGCSEAPRRSLVEASLLLMPLPRCSHLR
jgi:hypothetical protein